MPIIRLSAIEQQGVTLPDKGYMAPQNLALLMRLMVDNDCKLTQCGPGIEEDITPSYFTNNRYNYLLTTPPGTSPPETATVHLVLKNEARIAPIFDMRAGGKQRSEMQQIVIPKDSIVFL